MALYVVLGNWTEAGVRELKRAPERAEAVRRSVEAAGGRVQALVYTVGPYDFVTLLEFPSDDAANLVLLKAGSQGFARTTTLKAWSASDFAQLVGRL